MAGTGPRISDMSATVEQLDTPRVSQPITPVQGRAELVEQRTDGSDASTPILIGYARCSTDRQDLTAQRHALRQLGSAMIVSISITA